MEILGKQELREDTLVKRVIFTFLVISVCSISSFAKYSGGTGTAGDPYRISSYADLMAMAADTADYTKCFILTADIDLDPNIPGNQAFTTAVIAWEGGVTFKGVFDGNGHTIKNMTMPSQTTYRYYMGLFGRVDSTFAEIKNLGLINPDINLLENWAETTGALIGSLTHGTVSNCYVEGGRVNGYHGVGGLIGASVYGDIENCYSDCNVYGFVPVGGLVGDNSGLVDGCHSHGSVSGTMATGGLIGDEYFGTVTNSYATGPVTGRNAGLARCTGGLIGDMWECTVTDCFATGPVTGVSWVGGLSGTGSAILRCYATGNVNGTSYVGGLSGGNGYEGISQCFATGNVNGNSSVGGLIGSNSGPLTNTFASGNVSGSSHVGGLIGSQGSEGRPSNNYSTGAVSGTPSAGGLIGYNEGGVTLRSFWDVNTSHRLTSAGGTGKTTVEMKTKSTFLSTGWNFTNVWAICEGTNYPRLIWQIPAADWVCPDGVNFADYSFFAEQWMNTNCAANDDCDGTDFDFSGTVDMADLKVFCDYWLQGL